MDDEKEARAIELELSDLVTSETRLIQDKVDHEDEQSDENGENIEMDNAKSEPRSGKSISNFNFRVKNPRVSPVNPGVSSMSPRVTPETLKGKDDSDLDSRAVIEVCRYSPSALCQLVRNRLD